MKKLILVVAISLGLTGCASVQLGSTRIEDPQVSSQLVEQKADKKAVYIALGQPHDVLYENQKQQKGLSEWVYYSAKMETSGASLIPFVGLVAAGVNTETTKITYFFNAKERLYKTRQDAFNTYTNSWSAMSQDASAKENDKKAGRVEKEMKKLGLPFDSNRAQEMVGIEIFTEEEIR